MSGARVVKTLVGAAVVVLEATREAVSHAGWYLRYQVNGTTHDYDDPPPRGGSDAP